MSDKLKQFIDENREAFDSAEPDPQLLKKTAIVAAVITLSVAGYFLLQKKNTSVDPIVIENSQQETADYGDPVYAKEIYHFKELIGLKQSELKKLEKEYPQLYQQFRGDINELDSSYQSLKIKLAENPNREMLLEAMIQNLQLQSELLNRQLLIIKEIKQKSKRNEKTTI